MKTPALIISFFVTFLTAAADNLTYSVALLDSQLLKHANAIIRMDDTRFELISTNEIITKSHFAVTILNEKGNDFAEFEEVYNSHVDINSLEGILYDPLGKELKKVKKKDFEDLSAVSSGQMYTDDRVKRHSFYYKMYPYTVEYVCEIKETSTLFFPKWMPQPDEGIAVENSSLSIVVPADYKIRFKAFNYEKDPVIQPEKDRKVYTWSAKKLKAIIREPNGPMLHEITPMVITGPSLFQVDDYKGNMETWQDFGRFTYALKKGRDILPDNIKSKVHEIADPIKDKREKISALYEYMQQNTRYIGVQLGIGGWQPYDAKYVASNGYGDCKALTNYMYSLLKEAGIPSNYTLIRAGRYERYLTEDFPSQQFTHVILLVPLEKDTMWLECTSQTLPAGYLSDFTADRPALAIDENGGKIVRTPLYGLKDNTELRKIDAALDENGSLSIKSNTVYSGLLQDDIHDMIHSLSKEKIKEQLHNEMDFATYDIVNFNYNEIKGAIPHIEEFLEINVSNYANITGKRLFIAPNLMSRTSLKLTEDTARKYDIVINYAYSIIDTVTIKIPAGYNAESLPQVVKINSAFGNYNSSVKYEGNTLIYYRKFDFLNGRFPAKSYNDLVKFFNAIRRSDASKAVFVKAQQ